MKSLVFILLLTLLPACGLASLFFGSDPNKKTDYTVSGYDTKCEGEFGDIYLRYGRNSSSTQCNYDDRVKYGSYQICYALINFDEYLSFYLMSEKEGEENSECLIESNEYGTFRFEKVENDLSVFDFEGNELLETGEINCEQEDFEEHYKDKDPCNYNYNNLHKDIDNELLEDSEQFKICKQSFETEFNGPNEMHGYNSVYFYYKGFDPNEIEEISSLCVTENFFGSFSEDFRSKPQYKIIPDEEGYQRYFCDKLNGEKRVSLLLVSKESPENVSKFCSFVMSKAIPVIVRGDESELDFTILD